MKRKTLIVAAALVGTLALVGCDGATKVSGNVHDVMQQMLDAPVDSDFSVEVTGYIDANKAPGELLGTDGEPCGTVELHQDGDMTDDGGYIIAVFDGSKSDLEDLIDDNASSISSIERVTVTGTAEGKDVGSHFTVLYDCQIKFEE